MLGGWKQKSGWIQIPPASCVPFTFPFPSQLSVCLIVSRVRAYLTTDQHLCFGFIPYSVEIIGFRKNKGDWPCLCLSRYSCNRRKVCMSPFFLTVRTRYKNMPGVFLFDKIFYRTI